MFTKILVLIPTWQKHQRGEYTLEYLMFFFFCNFGVCERSFFSDLQIWMVI